MSTNDTFRIAIIGAGPAGLSLAITLKHKGLSNLIVYERERNEQSRHQGWSISLFSPGGGLELLERLRLREEFSSISFQPAFRALDGQTGRTLLYKPGEGNGRRFKRGDLRQALLNVCSREKIEIVWDAQVKSFTELTNQVEIHFVDPTRHSSVIVDLLIGADGLQSPIRQQLIGDSIRPAGFNAIVGLIKQDPKNVHLFNHEYIRNSGVLVSGRGAACWFAHHVLHDEIYWSLSLECDEGFLRQQTDLDKTRLHQLALKTSEQFFPLIRELVENTPVEQMQDCLFFKDRDPIVPHPSGRFCVSKTGRVTLIGDAAHPMIPFRGQGGNTALIDVWNLCTHLSASLIDAKEISNEQLNEVLLRYEKERIPLASEEILQSRENAQQFHSGSFDSSNGGHNEGLLHAFAFFRHREMQVIRHRRSSLVRVRVRVKSIRSFSSNKVGRKALSVVLGLVLLTALVLPSVLVYLLTLPGVSQTRLVAPVGFTNDCSGISPSSLWVIYDLTAMTMRINTSQCHFPRTPLYFTGLNGFGSHFCVNGYNAISSPTPDSFQVHARSVCLTNNATYLVSFAQSSGYDLFWTGFSS